MPDEKISDLPLTPAINLDDTYEKSRHNAAPSERATHQQLVTFMQTAMALVQLSGGKVTLNADGSVTFANGAAVISALGVATVAVLNVGPASIDNLGQALLKSLTMVDANVAILATGDMTLGGSTSAGSLQILDAVGIPLSKLNNDGSAQFAGGLINLNSDGSATLVNGDIAFHPDGSGLFAGEGHFANNQIVLASDGSASFGNNAASIDATGNLLNAGTQVVTAQQPAIADATNAVDVITQFNTLLAELRTHGLIAP